MITALTTIIGFLSSVAPMTIRYLEKSRSMQHEAELIKLRMEAAAQGMDYQLIVENTRAIVQEGESLRKHDMALDGGEFLNTLRASVRPIITYFFFFTFIVIKVVSLAIMIWQGVPILDVLPVIWDETTSAIFGACIGFWFGYRTMMHLEKGVNN